MLCFVCNGHSSIADLDLYVAAALGQADEVTRLVGAGRNATAGLEVEDEKLRRL